MKLFLSACLLVIAFSAQAQPCGAPPTINFNFNQQHICPGESATFVSTILGASGYIEYNWSPVTGNTNTIVVTPTQDTTWYYLEITDNCFTVLDSVRVIRHPIELTAINVTDATDCPGEPGTLGSIQILPDHPSFVYTLNGVGITAGPQTTNTFSNLAGGVAYFVHVENTYDCFLDTLIMVDLGANNVTADFDLAALTGATCSYTTDGAAAITNIGGGLSSPYTVYWTNVNGLHDLETGLSAGDGSSQSDFLGGEWVVTVEDQNGCAWSEIFYVDHPGEILVNLTPHNPTCYQYSDGSFTLTTSGGNGGNTFLLTNSAGQQIPPMPGPNNLGEGWYFATVTDSQGCVGEDSVFLDAPLQMQADILMQDLNCAYDGDGWIIVDSVYNAQGDYDLITYYWSPDPNGINGIGATENMNLNGGNYTIIINDAIGCWRAFDVNLFPDSLYFVTLGTDPWSTTQDGTVYCTAGGGVAPYQYDWVNLENGSTHSGNTWSGDPGEYEITVTDDNGCILVDTVYMGQLALDENSNSFVNIYPTLVQNQFVYIESQLESETVFTIYALSGELVFISKISKGKHEVKLDLAPGVYIYKLQADEIEDGYSSGKLIIAQN